MFSQEVLGGRAGGPAASRFPSDDRLVEIVSERNGSCSINALEREVGKQVSLTSEVKELLLEAVKRLFHLSPDTQMLSTRGQRFYVAICSAAAKELVNARRQAASELDADLAGYGADDVDAVKRAREQAAAFLLGQCKVVIRRASEVVCKRDGACEDDTRRRVTRCIAGIMQAVHGVHMAVDDRGECAGVDVTETAGTSG